MKEEIIKTKVWLSKALDGTLLVHSVEPEQFEEYFSVDGAESCEMEFYNDVNTKIEIQPMTCCEVEMVLNLIKA